MSLKGSDLVMVTVETLLGSLYEFPDMPRDTLTHVIKLNGWESTGRFVLVNASSAVLTMDASIVRCIWYDGAVQWRNAAAAPSTVPELPPTR